MKEWKDQAIVLHAGLFHEADIWLKLLGRTTGLHTVFAFGGAKSIRRFCGCLDVLNTLDCRIQSSKNGEYRILEEATLLSTPKNLRKNWQRMGIAINCLRFLEIFGIDHDSSSQCFNLVADLYSMLENQQQVPVLTPLFFRLNASTLLGFAPDFGKCTKCGISLYEDIIFSPREGAVLCQNCASTQDASQKRFSMHITGAIATLLKNIQNHLPSLWPDEPATGVERRLCGRIIDNFIQYHLGVTWNKGKFIHV